jgi:uncharacterized membrane protein
MPSGDALARRWMPALTAGAVALYSLPGLLAHWSFASNYDLAIFTQALWHLARLETPASTVRGLSNVLGDHFSPIIALLVPVFSLAPAPETLIVAQAVLFAASAWPVWAFLRRRLPPSPALGLTAAYVLFFGLQRAAAFDFHEVAFAPLFVACLLLAVDADRVRRVWLAAACLALVKEDLLPFAAAVGVMLVVRGRRKCEPRLVHHGAALAAASLAAFVLLVVVVVPALNDDAVFAHAARYATLRQRPWLAPVLLAVPPVKLVTVVTWLAPFAFLPLASPLTWLLAPFAAIRFLSDWPLHWGDAFHYSAPLAPILAMAAGDGLSRVAARARSESARRRLLAGLPAAAVVISLVVPGHQPFFRLFRPGALAASTFTEAGGRALATIPPDASVAAQTALTPHLAQRRLIFRLDEKAPEAEYIVAARGLSPWPMASEAAVQALVAARRQAGYKVVFEEQGWTVLRRQGGR